MAESNTMKEESERTGLKLNIKKKKLRSWHPPSLVSGKLKRKRWK